MLCGPDMLSKRNVDNTQLSISSLVLSRLHQTSSLALCLLCDKTLSNESMKPSRLKEHLTCVHSDKLHKPLSYFQKLLSSFNSRKSMFAKSIHTQRNDLGLTASYNILPSLGNHIL